MAFRTKLDFGECCIIHKYIPDQNCGNFHHAILKQLKIHEELKEIATRWQYLRLLSNVVNAIHGVINSPNIFMKDIIFF